VSNNPIWAANTQPWLANLKQACPSAYSYPFDDATSNFQCQAQGSTNVLGYSIGFTDLPKPFRVEKIDAAPPSRFHLRVP
jgi:hypothetical protein